MYLFGIDVGGTSVKLGFIDLEGNILEKWEIPTDKSDKGVNILRDITQSVKEFLTSKNLTIDMIKGFGLGIPGPTKEGIVEKCANLGWEYVDVEKEFSKHMGVKCYVKASNDANVAAAGEFWKGEGNYNSAVFITLGTGVGGGIIIDKKVVDGAHGAGGEIGHMRADEVHEFACNCGLTGCLETVASATGIVRLAKLYLSMYNTSLAKLPDITAKDVIDAAKVNDVLAVKVLDEVAYYIAHALSVLAAVIDPEVFFIGGGVSKAGDILLDSIKKHYANLSHFAVKRTEIKLAKLQNDAGMIGAAYLVK